MSGFSEILKRDDPRLRDLIQRVEGGTDEVPAASSGHSIAIIGFGMDEGCTRNGGRAGAALGPKTFREHLYKIGCLRPEFENVKIVDFGDVTGETLEATHDALRAKVGSAMNLGYIPFVVGGGNDQSYPNARGFLDHLKGQNANLAHAGVVNIDAHLDVRPLKKGEVHSGSPFRQLLEDEDFKDGKFVEYAAQKFQCSLSHAKFVTDRGHRVIWFDDEMEGCTGAAFRKEWQNVVKSLGENVFVSFDIDSIRYADCPGVSCPTPVGLSASQAFQIAEESGKSARVRIVDMSEFNPAVEAYNTGKLTAFIFWHFALGVGQRPARGKQKSYSL